MNPEARSRESTQGNLEIPGSLAALSPRNDGAYYIPASCFFSAACRSASILSGSPPAFLTAAAQLSCSGLTALFHWARCSGVSEETSWSGKAFILIRPFDSNSPQGSEIFSAHSDVQ